ncbi:MAG: hypothetical protein U0703_08885 [Anaerolineae bacterium]
MPDATASGEPERMEADAEISGIEAPALVDDQDEFCASGRSVDTSTR